MKFTKKLYAWFYSLILRSRQHYTDYLAAKLKKNTKWKFREYGLLRNWQITFDLAGNYIGSVMANPHDLPRDHVRSRSYLQVWTQGQPGGLGYTIDADVLKDRKKTWDENWSDFPRMEYTDDGTIKKIQGKESDYQFIFVQTNLGRLTAIAMGKKYLEEQKYAKQKS